MIGSNLGSALFRMVLICHEMHARLPQRWESFMTSLCLQDVTVRGIRFVDDLRVYIVAPLQVPFATLRGITYALLGFVYPPHIPFKTDHVNPTIGMDVFTRGGHLQWMAHGKALADFCCYADTMPQQIQPFFSFQNPKPIVFGGCCSRRVPQMCANVFAQRTPKMVSCAVVRCAGDPSSISGIGDLEMPAEVVPNDSHTRCGQICQSRVKSQELLPCP